MQALESGKPLARNLMGNGAGPYGNNLLLGGESQAPQKVSTYKIVANASMLR